MPEQEFNAKDFIKQIESGETPHFYDSADTPQEFARLLQKGRHFSSSSTRTFQDIDGSTSSTPDFTFDAYSYFRPSERMPRKHSDIMRKCGEIYDDQNIVKNIIDLMGDFTSQGIRVSHPWKSRKKFYEDLWSRINKKSNISERLCTYLYKYGNVFIKRVKGKVLIRRNGEDIAKEITVGYIFVNPGIVRVDDEQSGSANGEFRYYIDTSGIKDNELRVSLGLGDKENRVYLDDHIKIFYKKDDWKPFAKPITYGMIKDSTMLDKLDLADRTALDSAINHVRIYKLGSLDHKIAPTDAAFAEFSRMLQANKGSGCTNIMWTPDVELVETKAEFHQFLGYEKYEPTLERIYQGAGIRTQKTSGSGAGQSILSISVILKRMEYGRTLLNAFWQSELAELAEILGDSIPAQIEYDILNLTDESAHRALLVQLADRNLISSELLQAQFGHNTIMENARIKKENEDMDKGRKARSFGPYHGNDFEKSLIKLGIPGQLIDEDYLEDKYPGIEWDYPDPTDQDASGIPQQGRPQNSKDKNQRKRRSFKPTKASAVEFWATEVYKQIVEDIKPHVLAHYKKKALRELTADQVKEYEDLKTGLLFNTEYPKYNIKDAIAKPVDNNKINQCKQYIQQVSNDLGRELNNDEKIRIQSVIYASIQHDNDSNVG